MNKEKRYSLLDSIFLASRGIFRVVENERNVKIQLLAAFLAVLLGFWVGLTKSEWLILVLTIFIVLSAEIFNSVIEEVCNLLKRKLNLEYQETKGIRDMAAGAVWLLALASVIVGLTIFIPHLLSG